MTFGAPVIKSLRPHNPAPGPARRDSGVRARSQAASAKGQTERRRAIRHPYTMATVCAIQNSFHEKGGEADNWPATVQDLARGGICLCLGRRLEPGTILSVELHPGVAARACMLDARVVYVRAHGLGCWQVGCAFTRPLTDEELRELL